MSPRAWLAGVLGSGAGAAAIGVLPASATRLDWLVRFGPRLVLLSLAVAASALVGAAWRARRADPAARRDVLLLALFCGVLAIGVGMLVPQRMRIQEDESLLAATALMLARAPVAIAPIAAWSEPGGRLTVLSTAIDQHRLTFPVLTSLAHRALGYSPDNGLRVNLLLGWGALLCVALAGRRVRGDAFGFAWAALFALSPIYVSSQASAGLEVAYLFFMALGLLVALDAARAPSAALIVALCALGPLLAQTRTESVVNAIAFYALALWLVWRAPTRAGFVALIVTPWLYLPAAWHLAMSYVVRPELLGEHENFAWRFFVNNSADLLRFLAERSVLNPTGGIVLGLCVAGVAASAWRLRRGGGWNPALVAFLGGNALALLVILAYVFSNVYIAISARMALAALLLVALGAVAALSFLRERLMPRVPIELVACALLAFPSWRAAPEDRLGEMQEIAPAQNVVRDWLRADAPGCRVLVATSSSTFFVVEGHSAMTAPQAYTQWDDVRRRYDAGELDAVVGVQLDDVEPPRLSPTAPVPRGYLATELFADRPGPVSPLRVLLINSKDRPLPRRANPRCALSAVLPIPPKGDSP